MHIPTQFDFDTIASAICSELSAHADFMRCYVAACAEQSEASSLAASAAHDKWRTICDMLQRRDVFNVIDDNRQAIDDSVMRQWTAVESERYMAARSAYEAVRASARETRALKDIV